MVTEMVKGKGLKEAMKISNKAVAEALDGLLPVKMHCSVLAENVLEATIVLRAIEENYLLCVDFAFTIRA